MLTQCCKPSRIVDWRSPRGNAGVARQSTGRGVRRMATADGYLRSKRNFLRSMHFQDSIPHLKVPALKETMEK